MSDIVWERKISKGNSKGTGWLSLPRDVEPELELDSYYDVYIYDKDVGNFELLLKLVQYSGSFGFYIPKTLCEEYSLIKKKMEVRIEESEYYPSRISKEKRIFIPNSFVHENNIKENELYEVELVIEELTFGEVVTISKTDRSKAMRNDEYAITIRLCKIPKNVRVKVKFIRKIEILSPIIPSLTVDKFYLPSLFPDAIMGKMHENEMVIFLGNHVPLFTPIRINLLEFIHYFGCYYADGTKKGWAWRINASTPEQAVYYIEKYNQLIFGNQLVFRLTYSKKPADKRTKEKVNEDLTMYWNEQADVEIEKKKISLRVTKHDNVRKWNKCGSLGIKDNRNLVMELHLRIMRKIIQYLDKCTNTKHIWDFLFGILEGDGSVSGGKNRVGIGFAFNNDDIVICELLNKLDVKHSVDRSRVKRGEGSGIYASFWLFEILLNLQILSEKLFKYYPKRRNLFIERLQKQKTVRLILKNKIPGLFLSSQDDENIDFNELRLILEKLIKELQKPL